MYPILFEHPLLIIYSYPLLMGFAWGVAYHYSKHLLFSAQGTLRGLNGLFAGNFIFAWAGAKIFFLFASSEGNAELYASSSSFWLGGGFVFYGGLIFGLIFTLIYCCSFKLFDFSRLYLILPAVSIAHAIGRIGCLLAGCCYGTVCQIPWAINLHQENRHPVQLYEAFALSLLSWTLLRLIRKGVSPIRIVCTYFLGYSALRFVLEFFRGDKIRGIYENSISTSQIISIVLFVIFLVVLLREKKTS